MKFLFLSNRALKGIVFLASAILSGASILKAGTTNTIGSETLTSASTLSIASGNATISTGTLSFTANATAVYSAVTGAGTLILGGTTNSASFPDVYFNNTDTANSTANYGTAISTPLSLSGNLQRYFWGNTDHNGVDKYGVSNTDCEFNGVISGSGGMTFVAQDSYTGSNPMETPFALNAANTFTGPVQIQRGSVYLGVANAFPTGNVLQFNVASGNNGRFFLYGRNANVADLSSTGAGSAVIADGCRNPDTVGAATLTITENNPTTYSGTIADVQTEYVGTGGSSVPSLSLVKNGTNALTLNGTLSYSGTTTVNAGKLYINTISATNAFTVNSGGTLGGNGTIRTNVTVANGGILEPGSAGVGTLTIKSVALGAVGTDAITINFGANPPSGVASLSVTNASGLTNNGVTTVNVYGNFPSATPATYNLISYSGTIKGSGSFVLGTLPDQAVAYLTNNPTASALQLVVSSLTVPSITWVGAPLNNWDLLGSNVWRQTGTSTPANYTNGSITIFDDSAANFQVNIPTTVTPGSLLVSNSANNYVFSGSGGIAGSGLNLNGTGSLTLSTSNSYTGNTVISSGKLILGSVYGIPSGPGTVIVNGTLDLDGFSPTYNYISGTGVVDNLTAGGAPLLTIPNTANPTFAGTIKNTTGAVGLYTYGSGTLTLGGTNNYSGGTSVGSLTAAGGTLTLGTNNALPVGSSLTLDNRGGNSILNLGSFNQNLGAITLYAGNTDRTIITGTGTLTLSGDLTLVDPHVTGGGQDYTLAFATPIYLSGANRTFNVGYGNNAESSDYGDLHLNGVVSGPASLTLAPWSNSGTTYYGSVSFGAANTYTGATYLTGGTSSSDGTSTLALNVNNAFPNSSAFVQSAGTILDLTTWGKNTGITTGMGSLTGSGTITLGSTGVLTVGYDNTSPAAYSGSIGGTNGSLVKTGTGALTLSGSNSFTGPLHVNSGKLYINGTNSGGGLVTVASGATLGGTGTVSSPVIVTNGGAVEAGAGTTLGTLALNSAALGATLSDAITLNFDANPQGVGSLGVLNANGLTNNASVTVNVIGTLPATAPATYTLVSYSGTVRGTGSLVIGSLPDQAVAYLTNNTSASAIQLVVSSVTIPSVTWIGAPANNWDELGLDVWEQTGTTNPVAYADGDTTVFDDTATNFTVNLAASVAPNGVLVSNSLNNYTIAGPGSISGFTGLTKSGTATLTLGASNSYSGPTLVSAGTLTMGVSNAIPGGTGAGNVTINGNLDLAGFSPTLNNLSGSGTVDDLSAGGSPTLIAANTSASTFAGSIQNSSGTLSLFKTGAGTLSLAGSNSFGGGTTISSGTLQVGAGGTSGTAGTGAIYDLTTLALDRADNFTLPNDVFGPGGLHQNGTGNATLAGNLTYTGPTVVNAGTLTFPGNVTFDAGVGSTLTLASNAVMASGFVLSLNANASSTAVDISGPGTVQLVSTIDRIESFPDLYLGANNNGVSTANYGVRLASGLNLGSVQRLFWAISARNDVARYGVTGCDCQFAGPISGTARLQLLGQNSWVGVNTMEVPFAFNGTNTWTGPLEVLRGSVYLGNSNALNTSNVLILDPAASVNSRLFLNGFNASVSDLQSGGYGATLIANGNNLSSSNVGPATLTVTENNPTTFAGNILDWYTEYTAPATGALSPTLSLVKDGLATLTLTGSNSYSGPTVINSGTLLINGYATGGGAVTVSQGGVLGGDGVVSSAVKLAGGGSIAIGAGNAGGTLTLKSLTLGAGGSDTSVLNLSSSALLNVTNNNGILINSGAGSVTINVGGNIGALGAVPLITYSGSIGGTGFSAFALGSTPSGVSGYLSNDVANSAIDFVATQVTIPRWSGAASAQWSTNTIPSPKNWVLDSDGVTPIDYVDGETVKFDDTASSGTVNLSVANVSPLSVLFNNSALNYNVSGAYGVVGAASLVKQGSGAVLLATTNSYAGNTIITSGILALGAPGALPGGAGAGSVTVNGTLDVGGFSPTLNNFSGTGTVDNVSAGGSPVVSVNVAANSTFAGTIQNTTGSLGLSLVGPGTLTLSGSNNYTGPTLIGSGTLTVSGSLDAGGVKVQNGASLGGTGTIAGNVALATGSALNLTANTPLTVGSITLNGTVTVNVSGNVSYTNSGTYVLLNHGASGGAGSYLLAAVPGLFNSGYTATLNDTNNQLQMVVSPTKPTGTIADVKHVVIFMQENRSFDHYFGTLHGVHGFSDHVMLTFQNGLSDIYQPSGSSYELPFHTSVSCLSDLAHDWSSTHSAWNSGNWNAWVANKGTETMAYYNRSDLPYYYSLADNFTICDEYHCSAMTSTDPNRLHLWTGMLDPNDTGGGPVIDNTEPAAGWGTNWITYPQRLQKAGVSWKVYQASDNYDDNALAWFAAYKNAAPGTPLYTNGVTFLPSIYSGSGFTADYSNLVAGFGADVSNNTLPSVSWIVGPDVGSEHPSWSPMDGEILTKGLLDVLASNPQVYNSTVFILNYDENDGFFDHATPINPTNGTPSEFVSGLPIGLGVRVPCIIVSPWSRGGYVCSQVFDHTSVIRFLEKWTGVQEPNISAWRRQVCGDLTSALDFSHPNTNYPTLTVATENDCPSGTTASPPAQQTVPVQESGTLLQRPLPYQPNVLAGTSCSNGTLTLTMTNCGSSSVHFSLYPNAYRTDGPWPFDVASTNSTSTTFNTTTYSNNYDFSCYGPNGFLRRFAGNVNADCGPIEAASYINPATGGVELALANPGGSPVTFTVTNGYFTNSQATYTVAAQSTNIVFLDTTTNNGWYDLTATASSDSLFVRRVAGHVETNDVIVSQLVSSANPAGLNQAVVLTSVFAGYGIPTGSVQFKTNGVPLGSPVSLSNGVAITTATFTGLGSNLVTAEYSGDLLNASATNSLIQVITNVPPTVTIATASVTNECGSSVTLNAVVTGNGPFGFEWFDNTTNAIPMATNSSVVLAQVSVSSSGFYTVVVTNSAGSATNSLAIVVQDTTPPVITLIGSNVLSQWQYVPFVDPGATALDGCAGPVPVTTNGLVNVNLPGIYTLEYSASDLFGNAATNSRLVTVVAVAVPTLSSGTVMPDGKFAITFSGPNGQPYKVVSSADPTLPLADWTVETTGNFGAGSVTWEDPNAAAGQTEKFYRVISP